MPIILKFNYIDGTSETIRIPAEIWKRNLKLFLKFLFLIKKNDIIPDPFLETADVDKNNNYWPPRNEPTRFQLFK